MSGRSSMREGPLTELFKRTEAGEVETPDAPLAEPIRSTTGVASSYIAMIRVVGVGGGGGNAVNRMINSDKQALDACDAETRIAAGMQLTGGRGTGGDLNKGALAMKEVEDEIRDTLKGSDLVFITAGIGGGTGSGGAPVVARIAKELGALTIAVVTRPFSFEGARRMRAADEGLKALEAEADTVIVIPNDRLMAVMDRGTTMVDAFGVCDDLLRQGVQGITDLIMLPGLINLDFADVRTIIRDAGNALLGIGYSSGEGSAVDAAMAAIESPLLETPIDGARGVLLGVTGGKDLSLVDVSEAAAVVQDAADPEANIIFGATVDDDLGDQIWVTVVAADFSGVRSAPPRERVKREPEKAPARADSSDAPSQEESTAGSMGLSSTTQMADPPEAPDFSADAGSPPTNLPYPTGGSDDDDPGGSPAAA